jgi:hypothetical protein
MNSFHLPIDGMKTLALGTTECRVRADGTKRPVKQTVPTLGVARN